MQKFDVLITTQSNFSMMASRLADFDMIISPVHALENILIPKLTASNWSQKSRIGFLMN